MPQLSQWIGGKRVKAKPTDEWLKMLGSRKREVVNKAVQENTISYSKQYISYRNEIKQTW